VNHSTIKDHIENWRTQVNRHQKLSPEDINQLEEHLIDQVTALTQAGLDDDEAFLIAVKRLGDLGLVSREFLTGYTQKLWNKLALGAIAARISEFGFTPNKVAALGENIILLANLSWSAVLYTRFLTGRASLGKLQRWQTAYIPVYALWAWIVVIAFPVIFNYQ